MPPPTPRPADRLLRIGAGAFPVLLFLAATLALGGKLGLWNDDYFFLRQFDRVSMTVRKYVFDANLHYWRPIYRFIATPIVVALFNHDRVTHIWLAIDHALVAVALYALLRTLRISRTSAVIPSLLFLTFPAHYEPIFWRASCLTAPATLTLLGIAALQVLWARRVALGGRSLRRSLGILIVMALATFAIASMNEQPAFGIGALPILAWASIAHHRPTLRRALLAAAPVLACAAALGAYMLIHWSHHPPGYAPTVGSYIPLRDIPRRSIEFGHDVWSGLTMQDFASGAWAEGLLALRHKSTPWFLGIPLALAAACWILVPLSPPARADPIHSEPPPTSTARWLIPAGLAWFLACWSPIMPLVYPASPRLHYAPDVGLAIALAAILELSLGVSAPRRAVIARALALPVLLIGTIMMVGVQYAFRARWQADQAQAHELRELIPNPNHKTVFIPVLLADAPVHTGAAIFDRNFSPPMSSDWAGGWWLQLTYRRNDVFIVMGYRTQPREFTQPEPGILNVNSWFILPYRGERADFSFDRIIPFEVDGGGHIRLFTRAIVQGGTLPDESIEFPQVRAAHPNHDLPDHPLIARRTGGTSAP